MTNLDVFLKRLEKIGILISLSSNIPWVYIDKINGKKVTEKFQAEHGFTLAFLPLKNNMELKFTDFTEIFKLIRKYR